MIGYTVTITTAKNVHQTGWTGTIVDETKHTILLKTRKGEKTLLKNTITVKS